ncbi:hypothetical protein SOM12_00115 [Flavobacterium sp. CFBP9031]|nr:hypothetical protein [Flavobacterium sp. CFBP9031]MDY0985806.1 hypothetical protein [Flavobacterium sp. CFBP9031]
MSNCITAINLSKFNFVRELLNLTIMNLKRFFGGLLTILGIVGLIYTAVIFAGTSGETRDIKSLIIYGILGIVFFMSGISLVRTTKDES